jgi:hypothetical protein
LDLLVQHLLQPFSMAFAGESDADAAVQSRAGPATNCCASDAMVPKSGHGRMLPVVAATPEAAIRSNAKGVPGSARDDRERVDNRSRQHGEARCDEPKQYASQPIRIPTAREPLQTMQKSKFPSASEVAHD